MGRNSELIRQWTLLQRIAASRTNTIPKLATDLNVTTRTIRRDLAALQAAGFPIYDDTVNGSKFARVKRSSMRLWMQLALLGVALLSASANPLSRVTSDNYADACAQAIDHDQLAAAEQACYRALVNVDSGNLGPELKSQRLYNLGRVKRRLAKFEEAEALFKESLQIEEKLSSPSGPKVGRRLIELAVSLAAQDKWVEGAQYLERALPTADQFSGPERAYAALVFKQLSEHLKATDQAPLARRFEAKAQALR
jgi:tetratricopeptide (TPR) repeat protein